MSLLPHHHHQNPKKKNKDKRKRKKKRKSQKRKNKNQVKNQFHHQVQMIQVFIFQNLSMRKNVCFIFMQETILLQHFKI
jgi:hypothetical protein